MVATHDLPWVLLNAWMWRKHWISFARWACSAGLMRMGGFFPIASRHQPFSIFFACVWNVSVF